MFGDDLIDIFEMPLDAYYAHYSYWINSLVSLTLEKEEFFFATQDPSNHKGSKTAPNLQENYVCQRMKFQFPELSL